MHAHLGLSLRPFTGEAWHCPEEAHPLPMQGG